MAERPGFRGIPYALEEALRVLPPAQRSVLFALPFQANWEPAEVPVTFRGHRFMVLLDVGEALVSYAGLARDLRLGRAQRGILLARRALASGERLGLISLRPAVAFDGPGDAQGDRGHDRHGDTRRDRPPTIVRFNKYRGILWPASEGDIPRDTAPNTAPDRRPDTQGDTIPQETGAQVTRKGPSPAARARLGGGKTSDPRHAPLVARLVAVFRHERGSEYLHGGAKDGKALQRLLVSAEPDEIERRWRLALKASGFHRCDSFAQLAMPEHWNHFATASAEPKPAMMRPLGRPGA